MLEENKIMWLIDTFGNPRSSFFNKYFLRDLEGWEPETEEEKRAFTELVAPENRQQLKDYGPNWGGDVDVVE